VRAQATLTGACRCGGVRVGTTLEHEDGCPAIGFVVEHAITDGKVGWATAKALMPAELLLHAST
jgi:hypothetical protein